MPTSSPKRKSPRRKNRKALSPTQRLSREVQRLSREVKLSRKTKTRPSPRRADAIGSVARLSRQIQNLSRGMKARSPRRGRKTPRRKLSPEQKLSREITKTINSMTRSPASLLLGGGLGLGGLGGLGGLVKMNQDHKDALKITSLSPTLWPGFGLSSLGMSTTSIGADVADDTLTKIEWYSFIAGLSNAQMTVLLKQHNLLDRKNDNEVNPYNRLKYFQKLIKCCKDTKLGADSDSS